MAFPARRFLFSIQFSAWFLAWFSAWFSAEFSVKSEYVREQQQAELLTLRPAFISLLCPEKLVQRFSEDLADLDAKVDGRVVIALFDRADRLPALHLVIYKYILLILFIYSDMIILFVNQREPAKGGIIWQF